MSFRKFFLVLSLVFAQQAATASVPVWNNVSPILSPSNRFASSMSFNPPIGQIILFGGQSIPNNPLTYLQDTWAYDNSSNTWTNQSPTSFPPKRSGCGTAFDPTTGLTMIFGGTNPGDLNDTWAYNSLDNTWTEITTATSPIARNSPVMTFDPVSGTIILFGGYNNGELADTWSYDGVAKTWTELNPTNPPPGRDSANMVFDPISNQIILFGGYGCPSSCSSLNDTWAYDSTANTWTQLAPSASPSPRYGFGMVFDPCIEQIVIFAGGTAPRSYLNDTWTYNSVSNLWTNLNPTNPPGIREFPMMVYDPLNRLSVMFGGVNDNNSPQSYDDTQTLTNNISPTVTSTNTVTFVIGVPSSFTVTTAGCPSPTITEMGALPAGIFFVDNGDGTATLSGTPTGPKGSYALTFNAINGTTPAGTQSFSLAIALSLPPSNFRGFQKRNGYLLQTDYVNVLNWNPQSIDIPVAAYRIYRDPALQILIGQVPANGPLTFEDHNRQKGVTYSYYLVSVDSFGNQSAPAILQIN